MSLRSGELPRAPATLPQAGAPARAAGPFLYVAGHKISEYALGSSKPLRSTKINYYVTQAVLALDRHGDLCEANGDESAQQLLIYDARTLKLLHVLNGVTYFALASDRLGYVYATAGASNIYVYAPGCEKIVNVIRSPHGFGALAFDRSGNLYAGNAFSVSVFAPTQKPGHMRFLRRITDGINNSGALAVGPSGDLFVANWGGKHGYVTVYRPGGSKPVRRIMQGIKDPWTLAVDSKGQLYVANTPIRPPAARGWVSVYAPESAGLLRKVTDRIYTPQSLAIDPSDNLYVMNAYDGVERGPGHQAVTVYVPGGAKLLRRITKGTYSGQTIIIGSP